MFKSLQLFRLNPATLNLAGIDTHLASKRFHPCLGLDIIQAGWIAPIEGESSLSCVMQGHALARLCVEKKKIPSPLVKRLVKKEAAAIEQQSGFKPGRKELREIKERVVDSLLPKAFPTQDHVSVWLDSKNGWIGIDTGSYNGTDEVTKVLANSFPDMEYRMPATTRSPSECMHQWLVTGEAPSLFTIDRDCELQSPIDEKPSVRYTRHNLDSDEIRQHLAEGKVPTRLAMTWDDKISFTLTGKGEIKGIHFLGVGEDGDEDSAEARFLIMAETFSEFIPDLMAALGDEE